jgi:ribosome-binding ATPase
VLYVCNVEEASAATGNAPVGPGGRDGGGAGGGAVVISARIEEEICQLPADEAAMFLEEMGLERRGSTG